jgi:hypothetical protein
MNLARSWWVLQSFAQGARVHLSTHGQIVCLVEVDRELREKRRGAWEELTQVAN